MNDNFLIMCLQARFYEGKEPIQLFSIFQSFLVFKVWPLTKTSSSESVFLLLKLSFCGSFISTIRNSAWSFPRVILQGGVSSGYKKFVKENSTTDETYSEEGAALFRIQGSGPENMQAIQVEPVDPP